ncbi:MAG TPA: conditioned medium factor [Anaerolineae bacterium]|nr:conditioned medium factor [Anaerolineae bacterium]
MKRSLLLFLSLFALFALAFVAYTTDTQASATDMKQVAAPPSDFAQLQMPDAAEAGVRSQAAMVPVTLEMGKDGLWHWQGELGVDASQEASLMVFAPEAGSWELTVQRPNDKSVSLKDSSRLADVQHQVTSLSLGEEAGYPADVYLFDRPQAGMWQVAVTATGANAKSGEAIDGYIVVSTDSSYQAFSHLAHYNLLVGNQIGFVSYVYDARANGETGVPTATANVIREASLVVTGPNGDQSKYNMVAGRDGQFRADFVAREAGDYTAQVMLKGVSPEGLPFLRTSEHVFPVIDSDLTIARDAVQGRNIGDGIMQLDVMVASSKALATVQVAAEVWGQDAAGNPVAVAWLSGLVSPEARGDQYALPLNLDARWIALADAKGPFELRNVRIQNVDNHIPMATMKALDVETGRLPWVAYRNINSISEDMMMGQRPEALKSTANAASGAKLMLVHGYCSGSVWPTGDFTGEIVFADHDKNRSHDAFARLIDTFGDNNASSFGVVAHSQGGAASLHLYTYYWSGLDNASGSRLIQSVGTPYQGTALAGNLAILGDIFGAGCGTNFDLTYDGASLWLSNIPSWARSKVYYSTTSFNTRWWAYDYCHIATDPFLSDPDDGTTEKWSGQLSGANNMGHKKGWCHTNGMRDTAQYYDSGRNSNMNSYASR